MQNSTVFARLIEDYGSHEKVQAQLARRKTRKATLQPEEMKHTDKVKLMQDEERVTGSVAWVTYLRYFRFAGGMFWLAVIIFLVVLSEVAAGERKTCRQRDANRSHSSFQSVTISSSVTGPVQGSQGSPRPTIWPCMQL